MAFRSTLSLVVLACHAHEHGGPVFDVMSLDFELRSISGSALDFSTRPVGTGATGTLSLDGSLAVDFPHFNLQEISHIATNANVYLPPGLEMPPELEGVEWTSTFTVDGPNNALSWRLSGNGPTVSSFDTCIRVNLPTGLELPPPGWVEQFGISQDGWTDLADNGSPELTPQMGLLDGENVKVAPVGDDPIEILALDAVDDHFVWIELDWGLPHEEDWAEGLELMPIDRLGLKFTNFRPSVDAIKAAECSDAEQALTTRLLEDVQFREFAQKVLSQTEQRLAAHRSEGVPHRELMKAMPTVRLATIFLSAAVDAPKNIQMGTSILLSAICGALLSAVVVSSIMRRRLNVGDDLAPLVAPLAA